MVKLLAHKTQSAHTLRLTVQLALLPVLALLVFALSILDETRWNVDGEIKKGIVLFG